MLVLFDHGTPAPLAPYLVGHTVTEARNRGWDTLSNGDLLAEAERAGFNVFDWRQEHPIPAESCRPQNSRHCAEHSAVAGGSIVRQRDCGGGKRGYTWQLCRGADSVQVLTEASREREQFFIGRQQPRASPGGQPRACPELAEGAAVPT
jgi:hypothetical protein